MRKYPIDVRFEGFGGEEEEEFHLFCLEWDEVHGEVRVVVFGSVS